jgi:hypothetical protein
VPQIQPAERLWPLTNEPIVNEYFDTLDELDEVLAERCRILADDQDQIRAHNLFECTAVRHGACLVWRTALTVLTFRTFVTVWS